MYGSRRVQQADADWQRMLRRQQQIHANERLTDRLMAIRRPPSPPTTVSLSSRRRCTVHTPVNMILSRH